MTPYAFSVHISWWTQKSGFLSDITVVNDVIPVVHGCEGAKNMQIYFPFSSGLSIMIIELDWGEHINVKPHRVHRA